MTEEAGSEVHVSRGRKIWEWVRTHKVKSVLIVLLLFLLYEVATIPWFGVGELRKTNPAETALMRQRKREAEGEGKAYRVSQRWISLASIPKGVVEAVVVAEDGTFWSHGGFDWYEVQESVERNLKEVRAARGASTITQQLAKNLYLSTSKDPLRKGKEAVITLLLEGSLSKSRILELYLNCIEWGRGIFGIDAASRAFFGKSASSLTLEEGARLAAVIPSPLRHRPDEDSRYVLRRTRIVLNRLAARNAAIQQQTGEKSSSPTEQEHIPATEPLDSTETDEGDGDDL